MKIALRRSAALAHRHTLALMLAALLALALGSSAAAPAAGQAPLALPTLLLLPVTSGLTKPAAITNAGDGTNRLFITERPGRVRIYDGTHLLPAPFLDITSLVQYSAASEQGLLSVAFHPSYATNGYFYVYYTRKPDGAIVVARYQRSTGDSNRADPASAAPVLTIDHPESNHNGGQLQFGPDGYLYMGTGDGGGGGDQHGPIGNAQNLSVLLGKILRIDVNGAAPYAIPPSNPFVGQAGADEIWAYGLRNPWRFSFDRQIHDLLIGDVGQGAVEEIDFQPASSAGGQNYGWRCKEGDRDYNMSTSNCASATFTAPVLTYDHDSAPCYAVTGGYRYHGARYPQFDNMYFYADYCTGQIWGATSSGATWSTQELTTTTYAISTFGEDEAGELYLADDAGGAIYQLSGVAHYVFLPLVKR